MNADSQGALNRADAPAELPREIRSCTVCGANFSVTKENDLCPVSSGRFRVLAPELPEN
jgi:hypothetical protein